MKKDGKYRFSLQFSETTEENRLAGELLERMGNRKSALIVDALVEYLQHHPELQEESCKVEIFMTPVETTENLETLVRRLVEERIALHQQEGSVFSASLEDMERKKVHQEPMESLEEDISQMLDNLDFFQ